MVSKNNLVLVVDDDQDKRTLLTIALQMAGHEVRTANDGEEGLEAVEAYRPDLIIADTMMPKMDGYELARRVRANPQTRYIPIIIQTAARSGAQDTRRGSEVGALGYITDPTDIDLLLARARTLLDFKNYIDKLEEAASKAGQPLPEKLESQPLDERKRKAIEVIKRKLAEEDFDVFLCHNNKDKDDVRNIALQLEEQEILPWLDERQLRPGLPWQDALERQIGQIKSAAVFVGSNGIGPWQKNELQAFLREFVNRGCPVIPVLLPSAPEKPDLPNFLAGMTWVDFRKQKPDPVSQLIWGITGKQIVLEVSSGAAAVAQQSIQSKPPALQDEVEDLDREMQYRQSRLMHLSNENGVTNANQEFERLCASLQNKCGEVNGKSKHIQINFRQNSTDECCLSALNFFLIFGWHQKYANTIGDAGLYITLRRVTAFHLNEATEIDSQKFEFEYNRQGEFGWKESDRGRRFFKSEELANEWTRRLILELRHAKR